MISNNFSVDIQKILEPKDQNGGVFPNGCTDMACGGTILCPLNKVGEYRGYKSYRCQCEQEPIKCKPKDSFKTITRFDNRKNVNPTTVHYEKVLS